VRPLINLILKTPRGLERVAATHVLEIYPNAKAIAKPLNFDGIVFVENVDPLEASKEIIEKIPEVEKALPVFTEVKADPKEIAEKAVLIAEKMIKGRESFAVRTTRRGKHNFTSIDVNVVVGAKIKEKLENPVNLDYPDKVVWVEIFGNKAYISITKEQAIRKPKDTRTLKILQKISIIQMPYLEDIEGAYRMGIRIGRAAQAFEVGELVIAPTEPCEAEELESFLKGILEGRNSRYRVQVKNYPRKVKLVPIKIYDLFQLARSRFGEVFITTSARGKPIDQGICKQIKEIVDSEKRINIFIGSRVGVPTGIMRWSKLVVNLCPGVTFATEHGIPTIVTAILTCCFTS